MYTLMTMNWYSLRTYQFDTDLFWAGCYPILLGLVFLIFQWLINSRLLFSICVCVCVFLHIFVLHGKNLKTLSRVTASSWTQIHS